MHVMQPLKWVFTFLGIRRHLFENQLERGFGGIFDFLLFFFLLMLGTLLQRVGTGELGGVGPTAAGVVRGA